MAVDLDAIRRKVQELSGQRRNSLVQLWKPTVGEYKVRGLPWKSTPDGVPFIERRFYYIGNNPGILAPSQFGKPDPINDLVRKLYNSGTPDDRALAKQLGAKMRAYMPIIVRGQEDKGVLVWSFGKTVYNRLLGFYTEEEVGDILDPESGFDLKVVISQPPGKQFMDTTVDAARRPSKLSNDEVQLKKWMESVPNIDDMYRPKSPQEIEKILNDWLAGGTTTDNSDGSSRGDKPSDDLEKLAADVKVPVPTPTAQAEAPKAKKATKKVADIDDAPAPKTSLDDAFESLMTDE